MEYRVKTFDYRARNGLDMDSTFIEIREVNWVYLLYKSGTIKIGV